MNRAQLEQERKKSRLTVEALCKKIGINRTTYYRKTMGQVEFTVSEMQKIAEILQLENPTEIFFDKKVS